MGGVNGGAGGATVSLAAPWPGLDAVQIVDSPNQFLAAVSGLTYQPAFGSAPAILWAVGEVEHPPEDGPALLYRLTFDGSTWKSTTGDNWAEGKPLHYTDGLGSPDSEGITRAEWDSTGVYVSTERTNASGKISRPSVLRFDIAGPDASLRATNEWDLTGDLPAVNSNLGLESITWVPDSHLVANGFIDDRTLQVYAPDNYPGHGGGLILVGLEANGFIYAYALDHVGVGFQRVATILSGQARLMDLQFDREVGILWATCDNSCGNRASVLQIDTEATSPTRGRFRVLRIFDRPSTLPNLNNEGFAIAPESECMKGFKPSFWSDDSATGGHSLRRDAIPCGDFLRNPGGTASGIRFLEAL